MGTERRTYQLSLHKVASDDSLDEMLEINEMIKFQVIDVGGAKVTRPEDLIMRIEDAIHKFEKDLG